MEAWETGRLVGASEVEWKEKTAGLSEYTRRRRGSLQTRDQFSEPRSSSGAAGEQLAELIPDQVQQVDPICVQRRHKEEGGRSLRTKRRPLRR